MDRNRLENSLAELPIYGYAFIRPDELVFSDRVRFICRTQCPMYGKTWSCPPAVGTLAECRSKCLSYSSALAIATVGETEGLCDPSLITEGLSAHASVILKVHDLIRAQSSRTFVLSARACRICDKCAWPEAPCRYPERMTACVESHCILATDLAERCGIEFSPDLCVVVWFTLIFYD